MYYHVHDGLAQHQLAKWFTSILDLINSTFLLIVYLVYLPL